MTTKTKTITTTNVTGRHGYVIEKALAYAIEAIDRLPPEWQESSDRENMADLLRVISPNADHYRMIARSHLERRGFAVDGNRLVLAPRDPSTVVPFPG